MPRGKVNLYALGDELLTLAQLHARCADKNVSRRTLQQRLQNGWTTTKAIRTPALTDAQAASVRGRKTAKTWGKNFRIGR